MLRIKVVIERRAGSVRSTAGPAPGTVVEILSREWLWARYGDRPELHAKDIYPIVGAAMRAKLRRVPDGK